MDDPCPTSFPPLPSASYRVRTDNRISHRAELHVKEDFGILTSSFLRAAWALVISLYSDSDDVIFAGTLSGRQAPVYRIEEIAGKRTIWFRDSLLDSVLTAKGPTITTVPVRIRIDKSKTIANFMSQIHDQAIHAMPHEHFGIQNIRRISDQVRDAMNLQSLFIVQPSPPGSDPDAQALGLQRLPGGEGNLFDIYALNVECFLDGNNVIIEASYDSAVIPTVNMALMLRQFGHIIEILGEKPADTRLQDLAIVSSAEFDIMRQFNGPFPETVQECIHSIIEQRVLEMPEEQAICSFDGNMTYREVWQESRRLAHHLISLGVKPEVPVALCLDKGRLSIVAMLAVLAAGGKQMSDFIPTVL